MFLHCEQMKSSVVISPIGLFMKCINSFWCSHIHSVSRITTSLHGKRQRTNIKTSLAPFNAFQLQWGAMNFDWLPISIWQNTRLSLGPSSRCGRFYRSQTNRHAFHWPRSCGGYLKSTCVKSHLNNIAGWIGQSFKLGKKNMEKCDRHALSCGRCVCTLEYFV